MRLLLIEDSERLRRSLSTGLSHSGFSVDAVGDGEQGLAYALAGDYEVIILDLMLPRRSGFEVLERLRRHGSDVHILILSARDRVEDRVAGLLQGADDYLVKPFAFDELVARLRSLTRRRHRSKNPVISIGSTEVDTAGRRVFREGRPVHLAPKEYALLEFLAQRSGRVFSKSRLIEQLYPCDSEVSENLIEVLVCGLRKKLHRPGEPPIIETRRGYGYVIEHSCDRYAAESPS